MKSYPELMTQFYDEFPEAIGFVTFRHGKLKYPDVRDDNLKDMVSITEFKGNIALHDTWDSETSEDISVCTIATSGNDAFLNPLARLFNKTGLFGNGPIEQEFIFHHETYHAIQQLKTRRVRNGFMAAFYEECTADSYAALRIFESYGEVAIPFLQKVANWRMIHCRDSVHLSTFSIDRTIVVALGLDAINEGDRSPEDHMILAETIASMDELYDLVSNSSFYRINDVIGMMESIPKGVYGRARHPDWLFGRYSIAFTNKMQMAQNAEVEEERMKDVSPQPSLINGIPMFRR
jgi:hypothetical protein